MHPRRNLNFRSVQFGYLFLKSAFYIILCSFFIGILSFSGLSYGQNKPKSLDRRKAAWANANTKEEKIRAAYWLANSWLPYSRDSAAPYFQFLTENLDPNPTDSLSLAATILIARNLKISGQSTKAIQRLVQIEAAAHALNSPRLEADLKTDMARNFQNIGKIPESTEYYLLALGLYESLKDSAKMGIVYGDLGYLQHVVGNSSESEKYFRKGEEILTAIRDSNYISTILNNLGSIFMENGRYEEAEVYLKKAIPYGVAANLKEDLVYLYANRAVNFINMHDLANARKTLKVADSIASTEDSPIWNNLIYLTEGRLFVNEGNFEKGYKSLNLALDNAKKADNLDLLSYTYGTMASLEKEGGNYKLALEHTEANQALTDSLRSKENQKTVQELNARYEDEKKEVENALLIEKQERLETRQKYILWAFISSLGFMMIVAAVLWNAGRKSKRLNKLLNENQLTIEKQFASLEIANAQLLQSHHEKDSLMAIVAHDLKAPLNKIFSLLRMAEAFKNDEAKHAELIAKTFSIIAGGQKLIDELVMVSFLEKSDSEVKIEPVDAEKTVRDSVESFKARAADKQITLKFDSSGLPIPLQSNSDFLNRILDNLISNAIKFSSTGTSVYTSIQNLGDWTEISIKDEGPGIAEKEQGKIFQKFARLSNLPTGGESSTGLGLSIVKALVEKLKGDIRFESQPGQGTEFIIRFSNN